MPKLFPKKEDKVPVITETGLKSNRGKFRTAAFILVFLWMMTLMFGLSSIWVPSLVLAANFSGTAWLFGWLAFIGTAMWLFLANEYMDVQ